MALSAYKPYLADPASNPVIPTLHALVGGLIMTFSARLAGGCTSGHGLSGLSAMSALSLLTVAAMFGSDILIRPLLG